MEAFTYENIYYDEYTKRSKLYVVPPVSKRSKTREDLFRSMCASGIIVCLICIYFIKEISPLQMTTTDEQYGSDKRILDMSMRCSQSSWENDVAKSFSVTNIIDWSFKTYLGCPVFQTLTPKVKSMRRKLVLQCDYRKGTIQYVPTSNASDAITIPFNDLHLTKCLDDLIDRLCMKNGTAVPNIVHYTWYSYKQFGYFCIFSFMTLLRCIRPCLILIHRKALRSGKYCDYFIRISPKDINVRIESPSISIYLSLMSEGHSSHAKSIEAIVGK
ncbi:hypothetical protein CHS0354_003595 [Potamilus streckersoni]|uniref:Uncharacterized protein n=1 Tax=Potamilus streckersoni TaxID=2493646 RepID=A0AAE0RY14_9BIVA|nr:hypothetical protein CHS0354_003595 [Potamilus streckersoni]